LAATAELAQLAAELSKAATELGEMTAELTKLATKLTSLTAKLSKLPAELTKLATKLTSLTAKLSKLPAELAAEVGILLQGKRRYARQSAACVVVGRSRHVRGHESPVAPGLWSCGKRDWKLYLGPHRLHFPSKEDRY